MIHAKKTKSGMQRKQDDEDKSKANCKCLQDKEFQES